MTRQNQRKQRRRLGTFLGIELLLLVSAQDASSDHLSSSSKARKICTIEGGLDIARLTSANIKRLFQGALEDVELIREYVSEAAYNGGIVGGFHHDLEELSQTLDWQARNLTNQDTTVTANLGYSDDREDRRVERYVSLLEDHQPFVGTKRTDLAMIDAVSNIFPWIVDRQSTQENWFVGHKNGKSPTAQFDRLYIAAWIGTYGEAWSYYPPLTVYGHPLGFGDVLGPAYNSHEEEFVKPNLPENNPTRRAYFTAPYPDTAMPGLSLITAQAPIYYSGRFENQTYEDTYIASTGVDISVSSISTLLQELEGTLTQGSFAFLVDVDFNMYVISQGTVDQIYPERTGVEDVRVTYDLTDGSIIEDRRNKPYMVSDTILQKPTNLTNADWKGLHAKILETPAGDRGTAQIYIVLRGYTQPKAFHAFWNRWDSVAHWVLVVFVPVEELESATQPRMYPDQIALEAFHGNVVSTNTVFYNDGALDLKVSISSVPEWIKLDESLRNQKFLVPAFRSLDFDFKIDTTLLDPGLTSSLITLHVRDYDYPDCFFATDMSVDVSVRVLLEEEMNQIGLFFRIWGYVLTSVVVLTSLGFSLWVHKHREHRVLLSSQPSFLHMLTIGTTIMCLSIIPLGMDDSVLNDSGCDVACMLFPWLLTLGFSISFSALFSKIWRINQLIQASGTFRRVIVTERDVLLPFAVILSLNVILLLLLTLLDPLSWERVEKNDNESYGTCWRQGGKVSTIMLVLLATVNLAAVLLANIQAFLARNMSDELSESKYIGVAMAGMLQVFVVGVPVLFLVEENPPAFFLVSSSTIFLVSMSLLLLIFVPKFLLVYSDKGSVLGGSTRGTPIPVHRTSGVSGISGLLAQSRSDGMNSWMMPEASRNLSRSAVSASFAEDSTYSKAKVLKMKAKMEKAGLNVERFFLELEESFVVHAPRKTAVSFAGKDDGIRSSNSSSTINGPMEETTSRSQDTHSPTSLAKEKPSREHCDDDSIDFNNNLSNIGKIGQQMAVCRKEE